MNLVAIDTKHYSKVVRAFLNRFPGALVRLDKKTVDSDLEEWCTNRNLKSLRDFSVSLGDREILSFHDAPDKMMASEDQLSFIEDLAAQKMLRFRILHEQQD